MLTGGRDSSGKYMSTIHTFNARRNSWELAGQTTEPRSESAIEVIEDVAQQCPPPPPPPPTAINSGNQGEGG